VSTTETQVPCPYVGLRSYEEEDSDYFFGRTFDIEKISANLSVRRLTILYGTSGVGKTSLLRAGVVHKLRLQRRNIVVYFNDWQQSDAIQQLKVECLRRLEGSPAPALLPAEESKDSTQPGSQPEPPPEALPALPTLTSPLDEFGLSRRGTLLLVLDQFEDYLLTEHDSKEADPFDAQLARAVNRNGIDIHILIGIREEDLSKLDRLGPRIPNYLGNAIRLGNLAPRDAVEAIIKPAETFGVIVGEGRYRQEGEQEINIEQALKDPLISAVIEGATERGSGIDASILQMVMERLWDTDGPAPIRHLRLSTLTGLKGVDGIVEGYVADRMRNLGRPEVARPEPSQPAGVNKDKISRAKELLRSMHPRVRRLKNTAARIFRELVSSKGDRVSRFIPNLAPIIDRPEVDVAEMLGILEDHRIVRRVAPDSCEIRPALARAVLKWRIEYFDREEKLTIVRWGAQIGVVVAATVGLLFWYVYLPKELAHHRYEMQAVKSLGFKADRKLESDPALSLTLGSMAVERALYTGIHTSEDESALLAARDALSHALDAGRLRVDDRTLYRCDDQRDVAYSVSIWPSSTSDVKDSDVKDAVPLLAASCGTYVKVWNLKSNRAFPILQLESMAPGISEAVFSPTGRYIATANDDNTATIWEWPARKLKSWQIEGEKKPRTSLGVPGSSDEQHSDEVWGVAFSRDEKYLATASKDHTARIWDIQTGRCLYKFQHADIVVSVAFSPTADKLATASLDHTAAIWEPKSGNWAPCTGNKACSEQRTDYKNRSLKLHTAGVYGVAFSSNGTYLATASWDGTARVWETENGVSSRFFLPGAKLLWGVAFSKDGMWLAAAGRDGKAKIWEWRSGREILSLAGGASELTGVAFNREGTIVAAGTRNGFVQAWDISFPRIVEPDIGEITKVAFNATGTELVAGASHNAAGVWKAVASDRQFPAKLRRLWKTPPVGETLERIDISAVAFRPKQGQIATGNALGEVNLWSTTVDGSPPQQIIKPMPDGKRITALAFDPTGRYLAVGDWGGNVYVWDGDAKNPSTALSGAKELKVKGLQKIRALAFSEQGDRLAIAGDKNPAKEFEFAPTVSIWDVSSQGFSGRSLPQSTANLLRDGSAIAFSSNGKRLAVGFTNGGGMILDLDSGRSWSLNAHLYKHTTSINSIVFDAHEDGTSDRIATASDDGTAKVWKGDTGNLILTVYGHAGAVLGTYFNRHDILTTAGSDKTIRTHDLDFDHQLTKAKSLGRSLSKEECDEYLPGQPCPAGKD
jgi:WD40 repeat protein